MTEDQKIEIKKLHCCFGDCMWALEAKVLSLKPHQDRQGSMCSSKGESWLWAVLLSSFHWPGFLASLLVSQCQRVLSVWHQALPLHWTWRDSLLPRKISGVSSITGSHHTKKSLVNGTCSYMVVSLQVPCQQPASFKHVNIPMEANA